MTEEYALSRYEEACALLPGRLQGAAMSLPLRQKAQAEELRLRIGRPMHITFPEGESPLPQTRVIRSDLEQVLDRATEYSRYAAAETIRRGYVTASGGFRVGLCGTALPGAEGNEGLRDVSSLAIRIPRVHEDTALPVLPELLEDGRPVSTLILSPPGGGKTTLLRDLIRSVSEGEGCTPLRVSLADERGEVAAMYNGRPQLEVGRRTDVAEGCPKAQGLMLLLRAMNPQVLAVDEITAPEDVGALITAAGCGVTLLATAHGEGRAGLERRPLYRPLLDEGLFRFLVRIRREGERRIHTIEELR